jgi:hypothetical protein
VNKFTALQLAPYIDGNGLMAPCHADQHSSGSDNGVMFSAEAMLIDPGTATTYLFKQSILDCIDVHGELHRTPNNPNWDAPDDYYGALALLDKDISGKLLKSPLQLVFSHIAPYIQLQLLGMALEPFLGILNPLRLYNALVITLLALFSKAPTPTASNVDLWRMGWLLNKGMKGSPLCRIASKLWYARLKTKQGSMKRLATLYYQAGHPFTQVDWE